MRENIFKYLIEDSFFYGIVFILISFLLFLLRIYFKESLRMKNHSAASWMSYVNSWTFIAMIFMIGLTLLLYFN